MSKGKGKFENRSFQRLDKIAEAEFARSTAKKEISENFPTCKNPERRKMASESLEFFLKTYFPEIFSLEFSEMHLDVIKKIERTINNGELYALAMPRASGKTSMTECAILWGTLTGRAKCSVLVCANSSRARLLLKDIYALLIGNERLLEDFPEAVYPFYMTATSPRRLKNLTFHGVPIRADIRSEYIVFPNIDPDSAESVIFTAGLTGSGLRGLAYTTSAGVKIRPDFVLCDDPQDRESANSFEQTATRERLIKADLLGMAGAGKHLSCLITCTVIEQDDLADRLLDRKQNPEFHGQRYSLLESMPENIDLWEQYNIIREEELQNDEPHERSKAFYLSNFDEMNAGAVVTWKERFDREDVDALTYAMRLYFRDKDSFYSEYQNTPSANGTDYSLTSISRENCSAKLNSLEKMEVEEDDVVVTAFIDVHKTLLYFAVMAWDNNFSGHVIDYGVWPDNPLDTLKHESPKRSIISENPGVSIEDAISKSISELVDNLTGREYVSADGTTVPVSRILIDANWGEQTDTVYSAIKKMRSPIVTPSHGVYIGAKGKEFGKGFTAPGDKIGINWRIPGKSKRSGLRYCLYDTNFWKSFFMRRLLAEKTSLSNITIFGNSAKDHAQLIRHFSAEYFVEVEAYGGTRRVEEWQLKPTARDNHFFDCCVGCCVGASIAGVSLPSGKVKPTNKRRRVYDAFKRNQLNGGQY